MCNFFFALLKINQKLLIMFSAVMILLLGIGTMTTGIKARHSEEFETTITMVQTETNNDFNIDACVLALVIIGFFMMLVALAGCYGAFTENRGAICGFAVFLLLMGGVFMALTLCIAFFTKASFPTIIKETNRVCRDPAKTRTMLSCPAESNPNWYTTTLPPTNQPTLGLGGSASGGTPSTATGNTATATTARLLSEMSETVQEDLMQKMQRLGSKTILSSKHVESFGDSFNFKKPQPLLANDTKFMLDDKTRIFSSLFLHHQKGGLSSMLGALHREVKGIKERKLEAGTTERNYLVSTCDSLKAQGLECSNVCELLDEICETPDGFNVLTACICDAKGPQKLSERDGTSIVDAECPTEMVGGQTGGLTMMGGKGICEGSFCSIPKARQAQGETEEGCWVLPTTLCHKDLGFPYPGPCGSDPCTEFPYYHTGPCVDPDSRSKMVENGMKLCIMFVGFVAALSCMLLLTSMCSCCLFCEIHTGKPADAHARSILYGESDSDEDGDNQYGGPYGYE